MGSRKGSCQARSMKIQPILPEQKTNSKSTVKEQNIFCIPFRKMDTEIVTISRKPRAKPDTKPEIAREKLKEKRERLKKEKENMLIEEAKKRLAEEELAKKQQEEKIKQEEETKKMNDPMYLMMKQMQDMMALLKPSQANPIVPPSLEPIKKPRASRAKKLPDPEAVISEPLAPKKRTVKPKVEAPPPPKPKAPRKKKTTYYEESPSNVFVGSTRNNIPEPEVKQEETNEINPSSSTLLAQMMRNRRMNGNI